VVTVGAMDRRAGAGAALVEGEVEGSAADVGRAGWGALDQAVAVQTPFRDPLRAYLDGLTSAAS